MDNIDHLINSRYLISRVKAAEIDMQLPASTYIMSCTKPQLDASSDPAASVLLVIRG